MLHRFAVSGRSHQPSLSHANCLFAPLTRYLPGGDLLRYCNRKGLPLSEKDIYTIFCGLIRALVYLHNSGVVHADVKLENLIFEAESTDSLHLVDFGLSLNV